MTINSIYIVDEDLITIFGLKKILGRIPMDIPIKEFHNGKDALDAIELQHIQGIPLPSVIFLDINMPVMDGWTFLEKFMAMDIDAKIRIKIITSSIDVSDRKKWEYFSNKASFQIDFITKPIYDLQLNDLLVGMEMAS